MTDDHTISPHRLTAWLHCSADADAPIGGSPNEITPYGIHMVQADHPDVQAAASTIADKVLYCVIDDGILATHPDLAGNKLGGAGFCNGSQCAAWNDPKLGLYGTHASGTIAALMNAQGVVGVSATKNNLFMFNLLGGREGITYDDLYAALDGCLTEHEKQQVGNPAMKMVVSMDFSGVVAKVKNVSKMTVNADTRAWARNKIRGLVPEYTDHYNFLFATFDQVINKLFKSGDVLFVASAG